MTPEQEGIIKEALVKAPVIDSAENWGVIGDQRTETLTPTSVQLAYSVKMELKKG